MEQRVQVLPDEGRVRVIVCAGEFDQESIVPLAEAAEAAVGDPGVRCIALDVTGVEFADSTLLNLLLRLRRTGRLVLIGPTPHRLNRIFGLPQAGDLFQVVDSVDAARQL
ncbi:STAS domain-containing protein [Streptomyces sp. G-G2]|uniref:STAS domain-containing protein n=1 Tax=Streptomyces sp. G-G2 TaxID=3046201 RepID=UPI0024BB6CDD|nr:STAS domain-containing protein [Streptomyces sp. G-G2]MDJ0384559.1 STAS domain-containing protein [Streptomyces sp. G-G2]